jgi:hypothetical protein
MSWYHTETPTPFDHQPIEGLFYLHGSILATITQRDWTVGMKYPMIAFPSGEATEIWENNLLHLFGEMDLPLFATRDEGYNQAAKIASQVGYLVIPTGESQLELVGLDDEEHVMVTYDNVARRIVDVRHVETAKPLQSPTIDLLDAESRAKLPPLYSGEVLGLAALALVKFFTPDGGWTWYASEFDGQDIFFGLVIGLEIELGYFSLSELASVRGALGLPIERDKFFTPTTLRELKAKHEQERNAP